MVERVKRTKPADATPEPERTKFVQLGDGAAVIRYRHEPKQQGDKVEVRWYYAGVLVIAFVEVFDKRKRADCFVVHITSHLDRTGVAFKNETDAEKFIRQQLVSKPQWHGRG